MECDSFRYTKCDNTKRHDSERVWGVPTEPSKMVHCRSNVEFIGKEGHETASKTGLFYQRNADVIVHFP